MKIILLLCFAALSFSIISCSSSSKTAKADNSPKMITTPSGLQYLDIVEGTGAVPKTGQKVSVHYVGTLLNGNKFDSSRDRNQPFEFVLGGNVIKGWNEGIATMKVGGKRKLIVPPELAYGSRAVGDKIPANSTLIFEVELLEIK